MPPDTKPCTTCKEIRPLADFSPDKRAPDGKQGRCLACCRAKKKAAYEQDIEKSRAARRAYYANNPEPILKSSAAYRARSSEKVKARKSAHYQENRGKYQAQSLAYRAETKNQKAAYDRKYRKVAAESIAANKAQWREKNLILVRMIRAGYKARRRAAEKGGDTTRAIADWASKQRKVCRWCGVDCETEYQIDHVVALARGGEHRISNLCISCPPCNLSKNAKSVEDFLRHRAEAQSA